MTAQHFADLEGARLTVAAAEATLCQAASKLVALDFTLQIRRRLHEVQALLARVSSDIAREQHFAQMNTALPLAPKMEGVK